MLSRYRQVAAPRLDRIADAFGGWTPNQVSILSFGLFAFAALLLASLRGLPGAPFWVPGLLFLGVGALVFLGGVLDAVDGHLARRQGRASPRGDLLDHVLDRYADVALFLGLAVSGWAEPVLALLALVGVLLVSYMGTQAQAVLGKRLYAGLLGRADRIVLFTGAALVVGFWVLLHPFVPASLSLPYRWSWYGVPLTPWDLFLGAFAVIAQVTAVARARTIWAALPPPGPASAPPSGPA